MFQLAMTFSAKLSFERPEIISLTTAILVYILFPGPVNRSFLIDLKSLLERKRPIFKSDLNRVLVTEYTSSLSAFSVVWILSLTSEKFSDPFLLFQLIFFWAICLFTYFPLYVMVFAITVALSSNENLVLGFLLLVAGIALSVQYLKYLKKDNFGKEIFRLEEKKSIKLLIFFFLLFVGTIVIIIDFGSLTLLLITLFVLRVMANIGGRFLSRVWQRSANLIAQILFSVAILGSFVSYFGGMILVVAVVFSFILQLRRLAARLMNTKNGLVWTCKRVNHESTVAEAHLLQESFLNCLVYCDNSFSFLPFTLRREGLNHQLHTLITELSSMQNSAVPYPKEEIIYICNMFLYVGHQERKFLEDSFERLKISIDTDIKSNFLNQIKKNCRV
jgi:hypothetical protein